MIKKLLLSILFLCIITNVVKATMIVRSYGGCADCSGTASFIWECNSTTVGDTGYSPCGCSDGDTSASLNGDASIADGILSLDDSVSGDGGDSANLDNGSDGLFNDAKHTVFIKFKVNTWVNNAQLWAPWGDNNNYTYVRLYSSDGVQGCHNGDTNPQYVSLGSPTPGMSTGTWYILRYRFEIGRGTADHQLTLWSASMVEMDNDADDDSLTAFHADHQAGDDDYILGNNNAVATATGYDIDIEYVHDYANEWRNADDGY